jgi:hypothetical protein
VALVLNDHDDFTLTGQAAQELDLPASEDEGTMNKPF